MIAPLCPPCRTGGEGSQQKEKPGHWKRSWEVLPVESGVGGGPFPIHHHNLSFVEIQKEL